MIGRRARFAAVIALAWIASPPRAPADEPARPRESPTAADATKAAPAAAKKAYRGPMLAPPASSARPAGSRYDAVDWSEVPPWRQASFFGLRARGQTFVYVVDCSGSMDEDGRLHRAKAELMRSVAKMAYPQRFQVIFYNDRPMPMPGDAAVSADLFHKDQLDRWLSVIPAQGETDPRAAMQLAFALKPDAIFLLSDGEYPEGVAEHLAAKNPRKVPIHCIDLSGGAAGDDLERIARDSGGQYAAKP